MALLTSDRDGVMNAVDVKVTGTFPDSGVFAIEKKYAYIPLALAQDLLRMPGRATEVAVSIDNLDGAQPVAEALRQACDIDADDPADVAADKCRSSVAAVLGATGEGVEAGRVELRPAPFAPAELLRYRRQGLLPEAGRISP